MEQRGVKRVEVLGQNDNFSLCGTILGDLFPLQIIYKRTTNLYLPKYAFPPGWHILHSPNYWSTKTTMLEYAEHIVFPYDENIQEMLYND